MRLTTSYQMYASAHTHVLMYTMHACRCTNTHAFAHTCTCSSAHTYICLHKYFYVQGCMHVYAHIHRKQIFELQSILKLCQEMESSSRNLPILRKGWFFFWGGDSGATDNRKRQKEYNVIFSQGKQSPLLKLPEERILPTSCQP